MPTFPADHHLRRRRDFAAVYAAKVRKGNDTLLVYGQPNGLDHSRIGLSVSRRNGNAVRRNRIKRLLREAYRLSRDELPAGLDLILIPRPGCDAGLDEFRRSLVSLAHRLRRQIERRAEEAGAKSG